MHRRRFPATFTQLPLLLIVLVLFLSGCMRFAPSPEATDLTTQTATHDVIVDIVQIDPIPIGTPLVLEANVSAPASNGHIPIITSATATLEINGASTTLPMRASDGAFDEPNETAILELGSLPLGVHVVTVMAFDDATPTPHYNLDSIMIAVFDPAAGFVTGGGWFMSPPGAYLPGTGNLLEGKATFGVSAKYKKGKQTPDGNTEFRFQAAELNFHSDSLQALVVNRNNATAMYWGIGTVKGHEDLNGDLVLYKFKVWAFDGDQKDPAEADTIRIKIWEEDESTGNEIVLYDNGFDDSGDDNFGQAIDAGQISVQTKSNIPVVTVPAIDCGSLDFDSPPSLTLLGTDFDDVDTLYVNGVMLSVTPVVGIGQDPDSIVEDIIPVPPGVVLVFVSSPDASSVACAFSFNQPPVAQDDAFTILEDGVLSGVNVLADNGNGIDDDPDGDPLTVDTTPVSGPTSGLLTLLADGSFTYTPSTDFAGSDMFEYEIDDGRGGTDIGEVTITVTPVNDAPSFVLLGDQTVQENSGAHTVPAFATASPGGGPDEAGQTFTYSANNDNNGLFTVQPAIDPSGELSYTVVPNAFGTATVTLSVMDSGGTANGGVDTSPDQTFDIVVEAVRVDIEKLTNGNQADDPNDVDVPMIAPGDPVSWTYLVANTGNVEIPAADITVSDDIQGAVTVIVDDGDGDTVLTLGEVWIYELSSVAVDLDTPPPGTVVVPGCDPGSLGGAPPTYENIGTVTVVTGLGASDSDPSHYCNPGAPAAANDSLDALVSQVTNIAAPGLFADNGNGADDLGFPLATLVSFGGGSLGGAVTDNAAGATVAIPVLGGTLTVNADGSVVVSSPTTAGIFTFEYRIQNTFGFSDAIVTGTVNEAPVAQPDSYTFLFDVDQNVAAGAGLFVDNGSGADDLGTPAATLVSFGGGSLGGAVTDNAAGASVAVAGGILTINADGSWSLAGGPFTPDTYTVDYRLSNAVGFSDATVTLVVQDLPQAQPDALTATVNIINNYGSGTLFADNGSGADDLGTPAATLVSFGGGSLGGAVADNAAGASVAIPVLGGTLTVNADGSLTISNPSVAGIFTFTYRIENAGGFSDATVTVTIQMPPSAIDDTYTFLFSVDQSVAAGAGLFADNGSGADSLGFPSGAVVSFGGGSLGGAVTDNAAGASVALADGTLTINADGSWSLAGGPFIPGTYTFDYRITNAVSSSDATVTLDVVANLAPVITAPDPPTVSVAENTTAVTDVQTSDDNDSEGAGLTYSFTSTGSGPGIDNSDFNLNATTGVLTFVSPPDFESPGDANADNDYQIQVTVTDSGPSTPLTDTQDITVTVTNVNEADAIDDSYTGIIGNVGLDVPAGSGVLSNDLGGATTVTQVNGGANVGTSTATTNGTVTVQADGSFVYEPNAGNLAADSFTYEADGNDTATVTLSFGTDVIWFIDSTPSGGGNDGTLSNPFTSISAYNASSAAANHEVFLAAGSYTGPLNMNSNSVVIGEGASGSTAALLGVTEPAHSRALPGVGGARPTISGNANGISLASGNTVRGLNISTTGGTALFGGSVGTLSVSEVDTSAVSGRAVDLSGGSSMSVTIDSVSVSGSSVGGINLLNNTGTTTFGTVSISTSGSTGLFASNSGIIDITGSSNSITSSGGTGLNITNTTIGASGVTFQSIGVNGGTVPGIVLNGTGSGLFTVTGTGTTAGSGGTIENITDSDGITLFNTDGRVTFKNMIIEDIAASTDATDANFTRTGIDGIHGEQVDGGLTLDNTRMSRFSDNAINGATFGGAFPGLGTTTWNGLEILNGSVIEDGNRYHVTTPAPGHGDTSDEGLIRIVGLSGTVVVENSTLQRGGELMDLFTATSGSLDMTVQNSSFIDSIKEFASGPNVNVGKAGIDVTVEGSLDAVIRIGDPAETNPALGNTFTNNATASIRILHDAGATGDIDVVISQNTFEVTDHLTGLGQFLPGNFMFNFAQGGVALGAGGGTYEAIVSNNLFDEVMHADGGLGQLSITADDGGTSEFIVRGNNFRLPWDAPVKVLADGNGSAAILFDANTYTDGTLGSATDDLGAGGFPSPYTPWQLNVRNGGVLDITLQGEVLPSHDVASGFASSFDASMNSTGGTLNLWIKNSKSPLGYNLANFGAGTFNLYQGASGSSVAATIIDENNNTGGSGSDNTDPPVVTTSGTIGATSTAPAQPSITIP